MNYYQKKLSRPRTLFITLISILTILSTLGCEGSSKSNILPGNQGGQGSSRGNGDGDNPTKPDPQLITSNELVMLATASYAEVMRWAQLFFYLNFPGPGNSCPNSTLDLDNLDAPNNQISNSLLWMCLGAGAYGVENFVITLPEGIPAKEALLDKHFTSIQTSQSDFSYIYNFSQRLTSIPTNQTLKLTRQQQNHPDKLSFRFEYKAHYLLESKKLNSTVSWQLSQQGQLVWDKTQESLKFQQTSLTLQKIRQKFNSSAPEENHILHLRQDEATTALTHPCGLNEAYFLSSYRSTSINTPAQGIVSIKNNNLVNSLTGQQKNLASICQTDSPLPFLNLTHNTFEMYY